MPSIISISNKTWFFDICSLSAIGIAFYLLFLGSYPLFTPDEGRYAEIALNMAVSGDYITPRMNGTIFLDKPILHFWLQAFAIRLFGAKEWAVRLFPALFGMIGILMTYICGRHLFDRRTGLLSAIVLATTPLYFGGAHYANLDLEVAVLISCSLLAFIVAVNKAYHPYFLIISYAAAGFALLAKGLIGIVFPFMIVGIWTIFLWRWEILKKTHLLPGVFLILLIAAPWYLLAQEANPQFLHYFFIGQQIIRYLSGAVFNNQMPFWFFLPVILIGFLPWTFFLLHTLLKLSHHSINLFLVLWITIIFVFFSIPHSKLVGYILPIFPPLALLVGNYFSKTWGETKRLLFTTCASISILFLLLLTLNANKLNRTTTKPLALQLKEIIQPGDMVATYFRYFQDIPFYLGQHVKIAANWDAPIIKQNDNWLREFWNSLSFQNSNNQLINEAEFWQLWRDNKRIFVFVAINRLDQFQLHTKNYFVVGQYNNIFLISNKNAVGT
ncbi:MAG: hypothetical protein A3F11_03780 [Gammaproteobacteria bacterium RIFCSPHIGHO2_12_FULL_37_14]|nr:MAG: hypothetical protein A3F11_03780 [Gammaproteobacteria bacterium RIFCSPHIGHO2_12_FULL_37_14]